MRARWLLTVTALVGAFVLASCGGGGDDDDSSGATGDSDETPASESTARPTRTPAATKAAAPKPPADVCALVMADEPKMFAAGIDPIPKPGGNTTPDTSVGCQWYWNGAGQKEIGTLSVEVQTPSATGRTAETIKAHLEQRLQDRQGRELPGVGDYAIIYPSPGGGNEALAMTKGLVVRVQWTTDSERKEAQAEELVKRVVERIP